MSNIYFKNIKIENFLSYEFANLDLNRSGYIFVNGENHNPEDVAKSNGCGKSTLFNAIVWALTGQTTSGIKDISNIYTKGTSVAELDFDCGDKSYKVIRTKNPSNLKIYIDGEDKSGKGIRDSEKLLAEYLPEVTNYLLNSVIILGQGLPQRFTNNTPSGRKEVLETLSKSDFMIEDIKQRLDNRKEYLSKALRDKQDKVLQNDTTISTLTSKLEDDKLQLSKLPAQDTLLHQIDILSEELKDISDNKSSIYEELTTHENIIDSINDKLINLDELKQNDINNLELENTDDIQELISEAKAEISAKKSRIKELDSVTDVCPTCGQKLPDVCKIDTTALKEEVSNLNLDLETYMQSLKKVTDENNTLIENVVSKYHDDKKKLSDELEFNKDALNTYKEMYTQTDKEYNSTMLELSKNQNQIDILTQTKDQLKLNINDTENEIEKLQQENVVINNEIDNINKCIDINSKMNTIVKRDFRGYLLSNVIDFISNRCAVYSEQVFGVDNLLFALNGNNISISYDGKEYESLSGGEKQKVDVILQLSIRDMLCSYLNFSSNILVLDEITDSLDSVGAQNIFNLISNNLSDVETIYIISHHTDFSIPYDDEVHIIKGEDKISRIV